MGNLSSNMFNVNCWLVCKYLQTGKCWAGTFLMGRHGNSKSYWGFFSPSWRLSGVVLMAIENKLCDCGCGRSRPMQSGGKYFEPACRARDNRRKNKENPKPKGD